MAPPVKKTRLSLGHSLSSSGSDTEIEEKNDDLLPICPYGEKCYRKNPQHLKEFSHDQKKRKEARVKKTDSDSLPPCPFGATCYRKNLLHFATYWHPFKLDSKKDEEEGSEKEEKSDKKDEKKDGKKDNKKDDKKDEKKDKKVTSSSATSPDSGDETEVYESEDEKEVLDVKLTKSYSQMNEDERKELFRQALEVKKKLVDRLKATREEMKLKEQEMAKLNDKLSAGRTLLEGEQEALDGDKVCYFNLVAERCHKEGSAAQLHFRLAESQFYRLLSGGSTGNVRVEKVEYVVSPKLVKGFRSVQEELKSTRGDEFSLPLLAFHGTDVANIKPICETGFKVPGQKGFHHKTDTGYYGRGVHFSEFPGYSMEYINGAQKLLLCQVLPGKVFQCNRMIQGSKLKAGFDSHMSPCGKELIIFNSYAILPQYIVYYSNSSGEFRYKRTPSQLAKQCKQPDEVKKLYKKATQMPTSSIFAGMNFFVEGTLNQSSQEIGALVVMHGGNFSNTIDMVHFGIVQQSTIVCSIDAFDACQGAVAYKSIYQCKCVPEDYVYDCILHKKLLNVVDYEYT